VEPTTAPFEAIPADASHVLRPVLSELADEIIAAIATEVPDYSRALDGPFGQVVRHGVEQALGRFVDAIADPAAASRAGGSRDTTYVALGRGEMRGGRSLDALLSAYRVGARIAWRRFVEVGVAGGLPPAVLYNLGEAIFAYIEAISAESVEGYAEEQSARAGETQRRRRELVRVLAIQPPADPEMLRAAADAAAWEPPRRVAAVVAAVAGDAEGGVADDEAERLARRAGLGAVGAAVDGCACVLIPDPDAPGRRRQLETLFAGRPAAIGPTVAWTDTGTSIARGLAAARLAAAGRLPTATLLVADDHLTLLALHADPGLAAALADRGLAPLASVTGPARERLAETLRAWLDRPGQIQAVAAVLGVHPQTVRYRLRQLRDLYGLALEDPEQRLALSLALRASSPDPLSL
jgi:hypothetical protein